MTREAEFDLSLETETPATSTDPSADGDFVPKGFADQNYVQGGAAVDDVAGLKAVSAANRKDGDVRLVQSLDEFYKFDDDSELTGDDYSVIQPTAGDGRWILISRSGSGGGEINYLSGDNSNAEATVGDWYAYKDAAQATPENMFTDGSAPTLTVGRNTTDPMNGDGDFKITKPGSNVQGEGVACPFIIPRAYRKFYQGGWVVVDASHANYIDDEAMVFFYDVDGNKVITPQSPSGGHKIKKGINLIRVGWPVDDEDSVNYKIGIHIAGTSTAAYDLFFDDVKVGLGRHLATGFDGTWKTYTDADVSITSAQSGFSVDGATFRPFKDKDGNWFVEMSGQASYTAATISSLSITFGGMTFISDYYQAFYTCLGGNSGNQTHRAAVTLISTGNLNIQVSSSGTTSQVYWSGVARVSSKPTWVDFDPIISISPTSEDLAYKHYIVDDLNETGMSDATYTDVDSQTITVPAGTYTIQMGGIARATWSSEPTSGTAALRLHDGSSAIGVTTTTALSRNDADDHRGWLSQVMKLTFATETTIKLQGYVSSSGGTITSRDILAGYILAIRTDSLSLPPIRVEYADADRYGLVKGGRIPGKTDGVDVSAGYIGEKIEDTGMTNTGLSSNVDANWGEIELTPGVWMIHARGYFNETNVSTWNTTRLGISDTSATMDFNWCHFNTVGAINDHSLYVTRFANISSTTTFYMVALSTFSGGSVASLASRNKFYAVRVG